MYAGSFIIAGASGLPLAAFKHDVPRPEPCSCPESSVSCADEHCGAELVLRQGWYLSFSSSSSGTSQTARRLEVIRKQEALVVVSRF